MTTAAPPRTRNRSRTAATAAPATTPPPPPADTDTGAGAGAGTSLERVRAALATAPDLTVEALAQTTGLGKSTTARALTRLETAGLAVRTPGAATTGAGRKPDRWNPAPAPTATPAGPDQSQHRATTPAGDTAEDNPPTTTDIATTAPATPPPPSKPADPATPAGVATTGTKIAGARNPKTGTTKLAPGELTTLVAAHFAAHPGVPLTAGEVGRALGRSGGAVRNAADKLARDGALRVLDGTPRRYTTTG